MVWTFTWEANGQAILPLNNLAKRTVIWQSFIGGGAPPFTPVTEPTPLSPGSYYKYTNVGSNEIDLTVLIKGDDEADLWSEIASISYLFNPLLGEGVLSVTPPTGEERNINCYCTSGFRIDEGRLQPDGSFFPLTFFAAYPYWYDPDMNEEIFYLLDNQAKWFPILPLVLGSDSITAIFVVDNVGDVASPPQIIIGGPGENPLITNLTTGEKLQFENTTLTFGAEIMVDCKEKTVENQSGDNLLSKLTYTSNFWDFERGENEIQIQMAEATGDSYIIVRWYNWYLGVA